MRRLHACTTLCLALTACGVDSETPGATGTVEQAGIEMQGIEMQGIEMQGIEMQGMNLLGFRVSDATLGGSPLTRVRVQKGELVAERSDSSLRGTGLVGAHFIAEVRNLEANPPANATAEF